MEDASINSAPRDLRIICEFTELPDEVILDKEVELAAIHRVCSE